MLPARFRRQVVHLLSHPADQSGSVAKELTPLLEDINSKDWKIVYLARDPRGVMASRANLTWCQLDPACSDVRRLCADVQEDFELIERLKI